MQQITNPHEYIYIQIYRHTHIYLSFERISFVCFFNKLQVYINIYTNLKTYSCIFSSFECNSCACLLQWITNLGGFKYWMCVSSQSGARNTRSNCVFVVRTIREDLLRAEVAHSFFVCSWVWSFDLQLCTCFLGIVCLLLLDV